MKLADYKKLFKTKSRAKPRHVEEDIQAACVEAFNLTHPDMTHMLFAIPNSLAFAGSSRGAFYGKLHRLVAMGLKKSIPDLFLAVTRDVYPGLFIEMKAPGEKPRLDQWEMIGKLHEQGYRAVICYSLEQFLSIVGNYLGLGEFLGKKSIQNMETME